MNVFLNTLNTSSSDNTRLCCWRYSDKNINFAKLAIFFYYYYHYHYSYKRVLRAARKHELLKHDVILCTCTAASNPNFACVKLSQIIIDECAMATEPEALIPFVTHQPEQVRPRS